MGQRERVSKGCCDRVVHSLEGASDWVEIRRLPEELEQELARKERGGNRLPRGTIRLAFWFMLVAVAVVSALAAAAN